MLAQPPRVRVLAAFLDQFYVILYLFIEEYPVSIQSFIILFQDALRRLVRGLADLLAIDRRGLACQILQILRRFLRWPARVLVG